MLLVRESEPRASWTWAALLSSYRYWGLFLAFVFSAAASQLYRDFAYIRYRELGLNSFGHIETLTRISWILLAPLVAWIAIRTQPIRVLAITIALAAAASVAALIPAINVDVFIIVPSLFISLASASFLIGLPALLADARGGSQLVLIGFGVAWTCGMLLGTGLIVLADPLALRFGSRFLALEVSALLVLALSALLPIVGEELTVDFPRPDRSLLPGTYRYWGLVLAFVFSMAALQLYTNFVRLRFLRPGFENIQRIENSTGFCWILLAALVVWIALRTRPVRVLAITAVLAAGASAASLIPAINANVSLALAGIFIPLLGATLLISLPALLAKARGGSQPLVVGFGVAWLCGNLFAVGLTVLTESAISKYGLLFLSLEITILPLLAFIALLPIRRKQFTVELPRKKRWFESVSRDPVMTALLSCFVPFYVVYWAYRIHGEEAYVKPSSRLLTPKAAAWLTAIPVLSAVLFPIMMSTLAEHHNEVAAESESGYIQQPWVIFLWCIVCWPAAVGLVQARLNLLVANSVRSADEWLDDAMRPADPKAIHEVKPPDAEFIPDKREKAASSR